MTEQLTTPQSQTPLELAVAATETYQRALDEFHRASKAVGDARVAMRKACTPDALGVTGVRPRRVVRLRDDRYVQVDQYDRTYAGVTVLEFDIDSDGAPASTTATEDR
jgi:hypothetical protein